MNKAIMMTVKSESLDNVLNERATILILKTIPKNIELPCDVYLVCSKAKPYLYTYSRIKENSDWEWERMFFVSKEKSVIAELLNGKVVCKFVLNKVEDIWVGVLGSMNGEISVPRLTEEGLLYLACMSRYEFDDYMKHPKEYPSDVVSRRCGYAYFINNLVIFDKPKELNEFENFNPKDNDIPEEWITSSWQIFHQPLTESPRHWQYVYVKGAMRNESNNS